MKDTTNWAAVGAPLDLFGRLVATSGVWAATGLTEPNRLDQGVLACQDGGGNHFVLDLPTTAVAVFDRNHPLLEGASLTHALASHLMPGPTGLANWDGGQWQPIDGVPGEVLLGPSHDEYEVMQLCDALAEGLGGQPDEEAVRRLVVACREGSVSPEMFAAACEVTVDPRDEPAETVADVDAGWAAIGALLAERHRLTS